MNPLSACPRDSDSRVSYNAFRRSPWLVNAMQHDDDVPAAELELEPVAAAAVA